MAALNKEFMLQLAQDAVQLALKQGAAEAEAFVYDDKATSIGVERGQITKSQRSIDRGVGIRVQLQKAIGFAYTNIIGSQTAVEDTIQKAIAAAKASKPDPNWKGLPEAKPYPTVEKTFDRQILELHPKDLVDMASRMLEAATESDKRVFPIEGGVGAGYASNAIANSNGIASFDQGTAVECSLATLAKDAQGVTPVCFEFNAERNLNVDLQWVGEEAARLAVSALNPQPVQTGNYKVILTQFALQDLLYHTLINAVKADNVQRDQSPFKDKLGMQVGSEELTVFDDGLFPTGLRSGPFDAEGAPHQKTPLIENGVLHGFLYDNYAAKKEDKQSTGNAARAGYLSTPSIEITNFHILPGTKTEAELLAEVDEGLIVYYLQGAHSSNPVSGEFSVVATPAWKIKNGEISHATNGVMLAGNIFELLKNVTAVASNERKMGQVIAPWLLAENVKVIGK
ncbi:MAG: TldD/PmbA family protein [Candidatus Bathyarchaeota archaeon]|nr:TldD/PmbA family protein [Candidatus Bathyarchaeota archaeon]